MPCDLTAHLQESLYDQYQQRELTLQGTAEPDASPSRLAALTQQCVKQISLPAPQGIAATAGRANVSAAVTSVQVPGRSQLPTSVDVHERDLDLFPTPTVTNMGPGGPPGPSASKISSRGSLLGTALSRSVAVVGQLAQHVKGGRGTQRPHSCVSRPGERPVITADDVTSSDSFHQAVIGASIHQTLKIQGLSKSERIATIELMQQAGVISR